MKKKSVALVTAIGSATVCVVLISLYTYKRYISQKRQTRENCPGDRVTKKVSEDSLGVNEEDDNEEHVSQTDSLTSYESFDGESDSFCSLQTTSSELSCASTLSLKSDERGPFPVGEISTYGKIFDPESPLIDFHDILNSPVIGDQVTDIRMSRSPISPEVTPYNCDTDIRDIPDSLEAKVQSIVLTYHNIVPPLKPNTGEIIPVPKM